MDYVSILSSLKPYPWRNDGIFWWSISWKAFDWFSLTHTKLGTNSSATFIFSIMAWSLIEVLLSPELLLDDLLLLPELPLDDVLLEDLDAVLCLEAVVTASDSFSIYFNQQCILCLIENIFLSSCWNQSSTLSNFYSWYLVPFSASFLVCFIGFSSGSYDILFSPYGQLLLCPSAWSSLILPLPWGMTCVFYICILLILFWMSSITPASAPSWFLIWTPTLSPSR